MSGTLLFSVHLADCHALKYLLIKWKTLLQSIPGKSAVLPVHSMNSVWGE